MFVVRHRPRCQTTKMTRPMTNGTALVSRILTQRGGRPVGGSAGRNAYIGNTSGRLFGRRLTPPSPTRNGRVVIFHDVHNATAIVSVFVLSRFFSCTDRNRIRGVRLGRFRLEWRLGRSLSYTYPIHDRIGRLRWFVYTVSVAKANTVIFVVYPSPPVTRRLAPCWHTAIVTHKLHFNGRASVYGNWLMFLLCAYYDLKVKSLQIVVQDCCQDPVNKLRSYTHFQYSNWGRGAPEEGVLLLIFIVVLSIPTFYEQKKIVLQ